MTNLTPEMREAIARAKALHDEGRHAEAGAELASVTLEDDVPVEYEPEVIDTLPEVADAIATVEAAGMASALAAESAGDETEAERIVIATLTRMADMAEAAASNAEAAASDAETVADIAAESGDAAGAAVAEAAAEELHEVAAEAEGAAAEAHAKADNPPRASHWIHRNVFGG